MLSKYGEGDLAFTKCGQMRLEIAIMENIMILCVCVIGRIYRYAIKAP